MGLPATTSSAEYGGVAIVNFGGVGVVDPTTQIDAGAGNQERADVAGMTSTAIRATIKLTSIGAGIPTLTRARTVWPAAGNTAPVVARSSAGAYSVTFPASVLDELGVSRALLIQDLVGYGTATSLLFSAKVSIAPGNMVAIVAYAYADPTTPVDLPAGNTITFSVS